MSARHLDAPLASRTAIGLTLLWTCAAARAQTLTAVGLDLPARRSSAAVYDEERERVVLFGGEREFIRGDDTWEWDANKWIERHPVASPPARSGHAMVWHASRGVVLMFGGVGRDGTALYDTWEWNGHAWRMRAPGAWPTGRRGHAMAYDAQRDVTVMFGAGAVNREVWEWNGDDWRRAPSGPPSRFDHAMSYDRSRGRLVVFGGRSNPGSADLEDTWEHDGQQWVERRPSTIPPAGPASAVYDATRRRVVLFAKGAFLTTWEWDGSDWQRRQPRIAPSQRVLAAFAHDARRGRTVLVGGVRSILPLFETWEWDGYDWTQRGDDRPVVAAHSPLVYDSARDRVVMYGNPVDFTVDRYPTTWEWDGRRWLNVRPVASAPPLQVGSLAYDRARLRVVAFGGSDGTRSTNETWEWDGVAWSRRSPAVSPPARYQHELAYDERRGRVVMFGDSAIADTWEWDGASWHAMPGPHPPPRILHAMAYDASRGVTVLFGGRLEPTLLRDTWEWDGIAWQQRMPSTVPPSGWYVMTHDRARRRMVMGALGSQSQTWEWDGTDWRSAAVGPPPVYNYRQLAYDERRARIVAFGSAQEGTWLLTDRPANATSYGAGCGGATGAPVLGTFGDPRIGHAGFALELHGAPPDGANLVILSLRQDDVPIGDACRLLVGSALWFYGGTTSPLGFASHALPIPDDPGLRGARVFAQAAVLDAASALGFALTAGLQIDVGH